LQTPKNQAMNRLRLGGSAMGLREYVGEMLDFFQAGFSWAAELAQTELTHTVSNISKYIT